MSLTRELTRLIRSRPVTSDDLDAATLFVLDTLACAYAARAAPQGEILLDWFRRERREGSRRAFLFGALTHTLEMDDLHRESITHPACVVIPAAWQVAAGRQADGTALLEAVLAGYEACCRIGNSVGRRHYQIWHNTATCGPFGSAFAVATLLGLDEDQTVWALGNAGTQSSGLWQFLEEGAMSKHLHAGRAAESGLMAAELAAEGFTGPESILEGPKGFFAAACPDAGPDRVLSDPSGPWQLTQTSIKPWPSCRHTHPAVEAALKLHEVVDGQGLSVQEIAGVRVETYTAALDLCDRLAPETTYDAKFSLQHCVAAALTDGTLAFESFEPAARERLVTLGSRVTLAVDSALDQAYPDRWGARIEVRTHDDRTLEQTSPVCYGDPESPVSVDKMREKYENLFDHAGIAQERADAIAAAVLRFAAGGPLPAIDDLFA